MPVSDFLGLETGISIFIAFCVSSESQDNLIENDNNSLRFRCKILHHSLSWKDDMNLLLSYSFQNHNRCHDICLLNIQNYIHESTLKSGNFKFYMWP